MVLVATDVERLALGEQWTAHGPKVIEYVKRLTHEREWINERISYLHERWAEERAALDLAFTDDEQFGLWLVRVMLYPCHTTPSPVIPCPFLPLPCRTPG